MKCVKCDQSSGCVCVHLDSKIYNQRGSFKPLGSWVSKKNSLTQKNKNLYPPQHYNVGPLLPRGQTSWSASGTGKAANSKGPQHLQSTLVSSEDKTHGRVFAKSPLATTPPMFCRKPISRGPNSKPPADFS